MTWYKSIQQARLAKGMTAVHTAQLLSITPQHLSNIETGKKKPSETLAEKIGLIFSFGPKEMDELMVNLGYKDEKSNANLSNVSVAESIAVEKKPVNTDKVEVKNDLSVNYTNASYISSDANGFGLILDAGTRILNTDRVVISSRIGFSIEHAKAIHELLGKQIKLAESMRESKTAPKK